MAKQVETSHGGASPGGQAEITHGRLLRVVVVTPEATLLDTRADFVAMPLFDGEIGIAPLHSPMIGRLGYGELRVTKGHHQDSYYVDGGFVQVAGELVSVLTNRAMPSKELKVGIAEEQLASCRTKPAHTPELMAIRDRLEQQARAQIRVARKSR